VNAARGTQSANKGGEEKKDFNLVPGFKRTKSYLDTASKFREESCAGAIQREGKRIEGEEDVQAVLSSVRFFPEDEGRNLDT